MNELAKILGISRNGIYDLIKRGDLPMRAFRIGTLWKVQRSELEAYLAGASAVKAEPDDGGQPTSPEPSSN